MPAAPSVLWSRTTCQSSRSSTRSRHLRASTTSCSVRAGSSPTRSRQIEADADRLRPARPLASGRARASTASIGCSDALPRPADHHPDRPQRRGGRAGGARRRRAGLPREGLDRGRRREARRPLRDRAQVRRGGARPARPPERADPRLGRRRHLRPRLGGRRHLRQPGGGAAPRVRARGAPRRRRFHDVVHPKGAALRRPRRGGLPDPGRDPRRASPTSPTRSRSRAATRRPSRSSTR